MCINVYVEARNRRSIASVYSYKILYFQLVGIYTRINDVKEDERNSFVQP